jgi:hypothetical protein
MMARRPNEREAAVQRSLDRRSDGERRRLERRLRRDRVAVEPRAALDRADAIDVLLRVAEQELLLGRGASLGPFGEAREQNLEPLPALGVCARRVQARERWVRQEVDRTSSCSSSRVAPFLRARPSR